MNDFHPLEVERYAKHFCLPEVSAAGQKRLKNSRILCVGAGGLGVAALPYLAAAGVGHIGIIDFDTVELSNLHRQVLYSMPDIGKLKAVIAQEKLLALNPQIEVAVYPIALCNDNALNLIQDYDVVIDATDNFAARYLINDACFYLKKPDIYASILRFSGHFSVFTPPNGPCYRCLFPIFPSADFIPNCSEAGVLGPLPGLLGSMQAMEALKTVLNIGRGLSGRLITIDTLTFRFNEITLRKNPECILCVKQVPFAELPRGPSDFHASVPEITIENFKMLQLTNTKFFLLDVRTSLEYQENNLNGYHVPLDELPNRMNELDPNAFIIVHCQMGERGKKAVQILQANGFSHAHHLQGGLRAWQARP